MTSNELTAVVLAAGQGKRMKSNLPKVLHKVLGNEMLNYVLDSLGEAGISSPIVVVGHCGDQVIQYANGRAECVWQEEQKGTGHAVQCAMHLLEEFRGDVIITCGDTPLIPSSCYTRLIHERRAGGFSAMVATIVRDDPQAYGRIKRDENGNVRGIVEFRDATDSEKAIREVNSGTYCFEAEALRYSLSKLSNANAQGEYYLTDTIAHLLHSGRSVGACVHNDPDEFLGINNPSELAMAENRLSERVKLGILSSGVILEEPYTIRIEPTVKVGPRTRVRTGVILEGNTLIGSDCVIGPHVTIRNAEIPAGTTVSPHLIDGIRTNENLKRLAEGGGAQQEDDSKDSSC